VSVVIRNLRAKNESRNDDRSALCEKEKPLWSQIDKLSDRAVPLGVSRPPNSSSPSLLGACMSRGALENLCSSVGGAASFCPASRAVTELYLKESDLLRTMNTSEAFLRGLEHAIHEFGVGFIFNSIAKGGLDCLTALQRYVPDGCRKINKSNQTVRSGSMAKSQLEARRSSLEEMDVAPIRRTLADCKAKFSINFRK
jgi:hypothetical protein